MHCGLDRRLGTGNDLGANRQAFGCDHVAALAIGVKQQGEVRCAAVRVVLEPLDAGVDAILIAPEIDHAVVLVAPPRGAW